MTQVLFPPLDPYDWGYLAVDAIHHLYWEQCGAPNGVPVLFLHGGPGAGCSPRSRCFFDPRFYRIVLFDQRGAGRSQPLASTDNNTTAHLVSDIEQLRERLGIEQWLIFGGSWGSTLALAYGQAHPARCLGFVLRGIFLIRQQEIDWFLHGMGQFFPEAWATWQAPVPVAERNDMLRAYAQRLFNEEAPHIARRWAQYWSDYEGACSYLLPPEPLQVSPAVAAKTSSPADALAKAGAADLEVRRPDTSAAALALARLECHYMLHRGFMAEAQLLDQMPRIAHLPGIIVQGRYDMVCPPQSAWQLHACWPQSSLVMVPDAGHSAFEPGISRALVAATERMKPLLRARQSS